MAEHIDTVLDVTIVYSQRRPSIGALFAGEIDEARVSVRALPVPANLVSMPDRSGDDYRLAVREWLNTLWAEKDLRIEELKAGLGH
jgi:hypothetical protein